MIDYFYTYQYTRNCDMCDTDKIFIEDLESGNTPPNGTWLPTLTPVANVSTLVGLGGFYSQTGNIVTASFIYRVSASLANTVHNLDLACRLPDQFQVIL